MKALQWLLPLLLASVLPAVAQESALTSALGQLPTCAQTCLGAAGAASPCSVTNATCICTDANILSDAELCLTSSCTLREALTTKNATSVLCHAPVRNSSEAARITNLVFPVVAAFCALSRVIYKAAFSAGDLGHDDWSVLAALIVGVPSTIFIDRGLLPNGLGRDVWTVTFDQVTEFSKVLWVLEIVYFIQVTLLKLTLLFFFLRIFPKPVIRRLLWATIVFDLCWGSAFAITAIFQCRPISFSYTRWDQEGTGQCIDINALAWANAIIGIVLDVWMLALPLYEVFHLQLSWRKKASVAIMFGVGTFVTIISILRLRLIVSFATSPNPTYDQTGVIEWSNFEVNIGLICACLPALRVILVRMFPKILGSTQTHTQPYHAYGNQSRGINGGSAFASTFASGPRRSVVPKKGINLAAITYTKTFEVQHGVGDEQSLVEMDQFAQRNVKNESSSTSISSL